MPEAIIYAVVLNWNQAADTLICIDSLSKQEKINLKTILVDNGSTDNSIATVINRFPEIELIANPSNLGFAKGINRGITYALECNATHIFIVNNDAFLEPKALSIMMEYTSNDVGLIAPIIYYADKPSTIWSLGGKIHNFNLEKSGDRRGQIDSGNLPQVMKRDFITGCGMLIPKKTFQKIGLFDEGFKMYYEDLDFCLRVKNAHLCTLVITQAKMWHKVALSSGGSDSSFERYWMARSSIRYFRKHSSPYQLVFIIPFRIGNAIRNTLRLIFVHKFQSLQAFWRGIRDGLTNN